LTTKKTLSTHNKDTLINYLRELLESHAKNAANEAISYDFLAKALGKDEKEVIDLIAKNPILFKPLFEKLFWQHGYNLLFDFLCVIDGVADPKPANGKWTEVTLVDKPKDPNQHIEFLHDEL